MATSAERKALIFLAAVVCLGAGARIARSRGDAAIAAAAGRGRGDGRDALAAQLSAVDAARAGLTGPAGARSTRKAKPSTRTRRRSDPDSAPPDSLGRGSARPGTRRSRARSASSAPAPSPAESVDGWATRPVETVLAPGGLGTVRGGIRPPDPDTTPRRPPKRRRTKRP